MKLGGRRPVNSASRLTLVMFLWPRLTLAESLSWPIAQLRANNERYLPISSDWSGFYDWLRDENGILFGVRYSPFPEAEFLAEVVKDLPYVRVNQGPDVEIFFTDRLREPVPEKSCDQDFLYDHLFKTDSGKLAICTDGLTEAELQGISQVNADWLAV